MPSTLLALAACSGGGGGTSAPIVLATPDGRAPVPVSAAVTLESALQQVHTAALIATFVRPGLRTVFVSAPQTPSCDAATGTQTSAAYDFSGADLTAYTVFYPAGDQTCSQAPVAELALYYPGIGTAPAPAPQTVAGYYIPFVTGTVPNKIAQAPAEYDELSGVLYNTRDGSANLTLQISPYTGVYGVSVVQPAAGGFPSLLPPNPLPQGQSNTNGPYVQLYAAIAEHGSTLSVGTFGTSQIPASSAPISTVAALDNQTIAVAQVPGGAILATTRQAPVAYYDLNFLALLDPTLTLGAGVTGWQVAPPSPQGFGTDIFGPTPASTSTVAYAPPATVTTQQTFTDTRNQVAVTITATPATAPGAAFSVGVRDLLAKTPATSPAVITLDAYGNYTGTAPITFLIDGKVVTNPDGTTNASTLARINTFSVDLP